MIDKATFVLPLEVYDESIFVRYHWKPTYYDLPDSPGHIMYGIFDRVSGFYFRYYFADRFTPYSRLKIESPSPSKLIHGCNVYRFNSSFIDDYRKRLEYAMQRRGIIQYVDLNELFIKSFDLAVDITFPSEQELLLVLGASMRQPVPSLAYPTVPMSDGYYRKRMYRTKYSPPSARSGFGVYNKTPDVLAVEPDDTRGHLRYELRFTDVSKINKWFKKNLTLIEFFNMQDSVIKAFDYYLRAANIYPGCSMVSQDRAKTIVGKNYMFRSIWPTHLIKLSVFQHMYGWYQGRYTEFINDRQKVYFRDRILRDKYHLLLTFMSDADGLEYPLYDMIMAEINRSFSDSSRFNSEF